jgi:hypothetical protein
MGGSQVALAYATNRPVFIAQNTVIADVTPEGLRPSAEMSRICISKHVLSEQTQLYRVWGSR